MMYATVDDVIMRSQRELTGAEKDRCKLLLSDAGVVIDSYNNAAAIEKKMLASCTMVLRALGGGDTFQMPIGTTQGTMSALGYSQTFTMGSGSSGELYLTKAEKKMLGVGNRIGSKSPLEWSCHDD